MMTDREKAMARELKRLHAIIREAPGEAQEPRANRVAVPTVHNNGTARVELEGQLANAARAIQAAIDAMAAACPHDRDYYPQGPEAGPLAREQHRYRVARLQSVYSEIESIFHALED